MKPRPEGWEGVIWVKGRLEHFQAEEEVGKNMVSLRNRELASMAREQAERKFEEGRERGMRLGTWAGARGHLSF